MAASRQYERDSINAAEKNTLLIFRQMGKEDGEKR